MLVPPTLPNLPHAADARGDRSGEGDSQVTRFQHWTSPAGTERMPGLRPAQV